MVMVPCFTPEGHFIGHDPRVCGEHRTVGNHRAWCLDCQEWCYPSSPCLRCSPEVVAMETDAPPPSDPAAMVRAIRDILDADLPDDVAVLRAIERVMDG